MLPHPAPDRWLGNHSEEMRLLAHSVVSEASGGNSACRKSLLEPTRIPMGSSEGQLQFVNVINNEAGLATRHRVPIRIHRPGGERPQLRRGHQKFLEFNYLFRPMD
jgi:hypothetical protein